MHTVPLKQRLPALEEKAVACAHLFATAAAKPDATPDGVVAEVVAELRTDGECSLAECSLASVACACGSLLVVLVASDPMRVPIVAFTPRRRSWKHSNGKATMVTCRQNVLLSYLGRSFGLSA